MRQITQVKSYQDKRAVPKERLPYFPRLVIFQNWCERPCTVLL